MVWYSHLLPLGPLKNLCIRNSQDSQWLVWERVLLWARVLGLLNEEKLARGQTRNPGKALWEPCCSSREQEQTGGLAPAHSLGGSLACSLYQVRVRVSTELRPEGWLRWIAHLLGGIVCKGHAQYPAFAPHSVKVSGEFFGLFVPFGPEFAPTAHTIIFSFI